MKRALTAAVLLIAAPAAADTPSGMIGPILGVRQGTGDVSQQFGFGALWGIEAGWQPMAPAQQIGYALRWRAIFSGYWSNDASNVADELRVIEMDAGADLRFAPAPGRGRFVDLGGGVSVLRSNVPLAPSDHRSYVGPYVELGLEQFVGSSPSVTFELRVGEVTSGPDTASAMVGLRFGV